MFCFKITVALLLVLCIIRTSHGHKSKPKILSLSICTILMMTCVMLIPWLGKFNTLFKSLLLCFSEQLSREQEAQAMGVGLKYSDNNR